MGTVLLALCSLCCCSKETSGAGGGSDNTGDLTVIKFNPDKKTVLHNPLNGWVMYGSGSGDPSDWDKEIYVSELGKNVMVRDYASACYIRTNWRTFNPQEGVYAWRDPSTKLYKMIHGALDRVEFYHRQVSRVVRAAACPGSFLGATAQRAQCQKHRAHNCCP